MTKIRKTVAGVVLASALTAGILGTAVEAGAAVSTRSGARANTTLVCQRSFAAYTLHTANQGFDYARQYLYNVTTGVGSWGGWVSPGQLQTGFGLPTRGTIRVYVQFADWNGYAWEYVGEWGKVYNARGEWVSYDC